MPARVRLLKAKLEPRHLHVSSRQRKEDFTCEMSCSGAFSAEKHHESHQVSSVHYERGKLKVGTPAKVLGETHSPTAWKEGPSSKQFWSRNTRKGHPPPCEFHQRSDFFSPEGTPFPPIIARSHLLSLTFLEFPVISGLDIRPRWRCEAFLGVNGVSQPSRYSRSLSAPGIKWVERPDLPRCIGPSLQLFFYF